MLNTLRKQLTLICVITTATILSLISIIALMICEKNIKAGARLALENQRYTLLYRFQNDKVISHSYLFELETSNRLIVYIEENQKPFLFTSYTATKQNRMQLIEKIKALAVKKYQFSPLYSLTSLTEQSAVAFEYRDTNGEHYYANLSSTSINGSYITLVLLKNLYEEDNHIRLIRMEFIVITLLGITFLALFGYWFAGLAIKPIDQSQKRQSEFIASASHELRSPLTVLETTTSALLDDATKEQAGFIRTIKSECFRMKRLVDDLLTLAQTDAAKYSVELQPTDADTLLIQVYEKYQLQAGNAQIQLKLDLPYACSKALADAPRLEQVLVILIDNALSYTPLGGTITLQLEETATYLSLSVIDNGPGIPDAHKAHVFERFYRVDASRHHKEHYGLGLSIAFELIKLHKGKLLLKDAPDGGCHFEIQLIKA